jgi:hypothetical protein
MVLGPPPLAGFRAPPRAKPPLPSAPRSNRSSPSRPSSRHRTATTYSHLARCCTNNEQNLHLYPYFFLLDSRHYDLLNVSFLSLTFIFLYLSLALLLFHHFHPLGRT